MKTKLTAKDMSKFRKKRLKIVIKTYCLFYNKTDIAMLYDHEGVLKVYWSYNPNNEQKDTIKDIWFALKEEFIEHIVC